MHPIKLQLNIIVLLLLFAPNISFGQVAIRILNYPLACSVRLTITNAKHNAAR